jgi:hypothetical protein
MLSINHSNSSPSWITEAVNILNTHNEMEQRDLLIDGMIEYIQYRHLEKRNLIVPVRKAYSFFFQEKQPKVALVHKKRGNNEKYQIAKKVSVWWKRLGMEEKKIYHLLEKIDTIRYEQEHKTLNEEMYQVIQWIEQNRYIISSWSTDMIDEWIQSYFKKL